MEYIVKYQPKISLGPNSRSKWVPKFFFKVLDQAGMNYFFKVSNTRIRLPRLVDTSVDQFPIGFQSHLR